MKSRQFCSVCKDWLDMEVVPTSDGDDDDGVVWYRCPQCQGFLPKLKSASEEEDEPESSGEPGVEAQESKDECLPWDSPAAMMKELDEGSDSEGSSPASDDDVLVGVEPQEPVSESKVPVEDEPSEKKETEPSEPPEDVEPILQYASMLADSDIAEAVPYRPWDDYEVGQCVNHLAWNDCGVVVAKEELPGGRKIIKCYFEAAGIVRLIVKAPR